MFFKPQPAMQHNNTVIYLKVRVPSVPSVTRVRPREAQDVDPSHLREVSQGQCLEKAPSKASLPLLKAPTCAFTNKNLLRHYARCLNMVFKMCNWDIIYLQRS